MTAWYSRARSSFSKSISLARVISGLPSFPVLVGWGAVELGDINVFSWIRAVSLGTNMRDQTTAGVCSLKNTRADAGLMHEPLNSSAKSNLPHQYEHQNDHQQQAQASTRVVTPTATVRPGGNSPKQ